MFENAPVEGATVTFAPTGDGSGEQRVATATTDAKGRFSMMTLNPGDGVFPGEYAVSVAKTKQMGEPKKETMLDGTAVERGRTDERIRDKLPEKYKTPKLPSRPGRRR